MLGYSKVELPDTLDSLGKLIHPDDVENTALLIAEYILCGGVFDA